MSAHPASACLALALAIALATPAQAQHGHAAEDHSGHARPPSHAAHDDTPSAQHHQDRRDHPRPAHASTPSDLPPPDHVPPPAPATEVPPLSHAEMDALMGMDDNARFGRFTARELELARGGVMAWSIEAWYGSDRNRLHIQSEGEREDGRTGPADVEVFWGRALAPFWNGRLGLRRDFGAGPQRTWAAFGMEGIAPFWFDVDATLYIGDAGRTAFRIEADYDLLLSQRWVLQPQLELDAYGKDDPARGIGSGLSSVGAALRLRYELRREFAPYIGIEHARVFGRSAGFARDAGHPARETRWMAGLRFWF